MMVGSLLRLLLSSSHSYLLKWPLTLLSNTSKTYFQERYHTLTTSPSLRGLGGSPTRFCHAHIDHKHNLITAITNH